MEEAKGRNAPASDNRGPNFSAFISYSHADAKAVRKLHSQLESYRLPKGVGAIDALNTQRKGLGKVFRDREDLSAAESLSDAVTDALSRSQVLVVVCSPEAKASPWVEQEIAFFKEHCPGQPILAAIVRGEPQEVFPKVLTQGGVEPLAADLRKEGDGWKLGFLKVVAGIAGVPLDALVQRDSQRQLRRVMAITGVTALMALAMGAMAMVAIQSRNEALAAQKLAEEQRAQAEGLVGYMMTDLRDELEGVGRLDVMQGVNRRVFKYFETQGDPKNLTTKGLDLFAQAYLKRGSDHEAEGALEAAREDFEQAYRYTAELLERDQGNPERIYAHSQSEFFVGYAAWREVNTDKARQHFETYRIFADQLIKIDAEKPEWLMEAGFARSNLATVAMRGDGAFTEAESLYTEAAEYFSKASLRQPDEAWIRREIADVNAWLATVNRVQGKFGAALKYRKSEHALLNDLRADEPENAVYQRDLIGSAIGMAQVEIDRKNYGAARQVLLQARTDVRRLIPMFPDTEKLRLQERVISLLLVKADPDLSAASRRVLQGCPRDDVIAEEQELEAFCRSLRAKAGLERAGEGAQFSSPYPKMKLTPRWGLDL